MVRLAVLVVLLISAAAVSKLMAINITSARNITWNKDAMTGSINGAMSVSNLTSMECACLQNPHVPDAPCTCVLGSGINLLGPYRPPPPWA
jgi:hypothetical protein